jgi:hypothetical protein
LGKLSITASAVGKNEVSRPHVIGSFWAPIMWQ